ncbi:MAG: ribonuclease domain-containing protein [Betaproteobacteria bacterium]
MVPGPLRRYALALAAAAVVALATSACARTSSATVAAADLPKEARATLAIIRGGPPFRYERDGIAFGNREKLLPAESRGYYREYTVPTPGASNRGARRIVCGGVPRTPDACWYTGDHYRSFARIVE